VVAVSRESALPAPTGRDPAGIFGQHTGSIKVRKPAVAAGKMAALDVPPANTELD